MGQYASAEVGWAFMVARVAFVPAGAVDGTRACTMPHERAAIKAPAQPYTTPAPTESWATFAASNRHRSNEKPINIRRGEGGGEG